MALMLLRERRQRPDLDAPELDLRSFRLNGDSFPAGSPETEAEVWGSDAQVTIQELSGIGHNFNLHFGRLASWEGIDAWLRQTLAK